MFESLTFSLSIVHGNDGYETWSDTGLDETEEESLNHDTGIILAEDGHDDTDAPSHDQACACASERESLGSKTDERKTDNVADADEKSKVLALTTLAHAD